MSDSVWVAVRAAALGLLLPFAAVLEPGVLVAGEGLEAALAGVFYRDSRNQPASQTWGQPEQEAAALLARAWNDRPVDDFAPRALFELVEAYPQVSLPEPVVSAATRAGMLPTVSIVICSVDSARLSLAKASYASALRGWPHEFVVITDASSLAEGYRRGLSRCSGDWVVFSHDDVQVLSPALGPAIARALARLDVVGVVGTRRLTGPAWGWSGRAEGRGRIIQPIPGNRGLWVHALSFPEPITEGLQALDGLFFAAPRDVAERIGFDANTFDGFHFYDLDFTYRAARAGLRVGVSQEILLIHDSLGDFGAEWQEHATRFLAKFKLPVTSHAGPPLPRGIVFDSTVKAAEACQRVDTICRSLA